MILPATNENINTAINILKSGNILIFPTDTVFGIGCIATIPSAIEKIYELKHRSHTKSLLLNVATLSDIETLAYLSPTHKKLIQKFMPGPLSLILRVKPNTNLAPQVIQNGTIGIRIPNTPTLLKIISQVGSPIISTSCNLSGETSALTPQMAESIFPTTPILAPKSGEKLSGLPSTILDCTNDTVKIIRQGSIPETEISTFLQQQSPTN